MIIGVENSSWNNVGDGFYQFSLVRMFEREFPEHAVRMIDAPAHRSFKIDRSAKSRAYDTRGDLDLDVLVFSGPILGSTFMADYAPVIRDHVKRGGRYMLVSVHGDSSKAKDIVPFLEEYPPMLLASRDRSTHQHFTSPHYASYDGVCAASLVSITCSDDLLDVRQDVDYVTVSFYDGYEPELELRYGSDGAIVGVNGLSSWRRERNWRVLRHFEGLKRYPSTIDGRKVIRPVHDISYPLNHLRYARDNSLLSYNPLVYLGVYKGTSLTVSNRLHAVLPTLSFGRPAAYIGATARNGALERLGLQNHQDNLLTLEHSALQNEYDALVDALRRSGL